MLCGLRSRVSVFVRLEQEIVRRYISSGVRDVELLVEARFFQVCRSVSG